MLLRQWFVLSVTLLMLSGVLSACRADDGYGHILPMANESSMPVEVQMAPHRVAETYRFAAANPDILKKIPCYCGCGPMGVLHTGTTDNWFDRRWWLWGHEEHSAGEESASAVARSEPNRPKIKALESGCARGDVVTKGIQSIQGVPDRVAF